MMATLLAALTLALGGGTAGALINGVFGRRQSRISGDKDVAATDKIEAEAAVLFDSRYTGLIDRFEKIVSRQDSELQLVRARMVELEARLAETTARAVNSEKHTRRLYDMHAYLSMETFVDDGWLDLLNTEAELRYGVRVGIMLDDVDCHVALGHETRPIEDLGPAQRPTLALQRKRASARAAAAARTRADAGHGPFPPEDITPNDTTTRTNNKENTDE